jgi:DNA polymerase III sliding clamp (beta) subunit (PCNA family)
MPKESDHKAVFDLDEMRSAVRRISLMADERNRSIRVTFREGEVEVTAQSSEEGEGAEVVQADYKGEEITLGFNHQYLLEFLNNVGQSELTLSGSAESGQSADTGRNAAVKERSTSDENSGAAAAAPARESRSPLRIAFEFKDANAATQMRIDGDTAYDYKYIVMPLRI